MSSTENWWKSDKPHEVLVPLIKHHIINQSRDAEYRKWAQAYMGSSVENWSWSMIDNVDPGLSDIDPIGFNLIRSGVDTVTNRIGKISTRPSFVTNNGEWNERRTAEKLDAFVYTQMKTHKYQSCKRAAFRDAALFGDGFVKFYTQGDNIFFERTFPLEIVLDRSEGIYGEVEVMHQARAASREKLMAFFPNKKSEILNLPQLSPERAYFHSPMSDNVQVSESWKLPIWELEDGKIKILEPGKHVICSDNVTFLSHEWNMIRFPFIHFQWMPRPLGYFGMGIAEQVYGIHMQIQKLLSDIRMNMYYNSAPFWWLGPDSGVLKTHISNEIGRIIESTQSPELKVFATTHPEVFNHLQWLIDSGYREIGISELSAQSKKPSGLDSGKALREWDDIESERFITIGQQMEEQTIEASHIMVDLMSEKAKEKPDLKVSYKDKKKNIMAQVLWKDICLEESKYVIEALPRSGLSDSFSGRIQDSKDLMDLGVIDSYTVADMFDFPDVKANQTLVQSARNYVKDVIDKILDKGEFNSPEESMDLDFAVKYSTLMYNKMRVEGFDDEDRLEQLRTFTAQAQDLKDQAIADVPQAVPGEQVPEQGIVPGQMPAMPEIMQ